VDTVEVACNRTHVVVTGDCYLKGQAKKDESPSPIVARQFNHRAAVAT
jgi:hypothetical protein